MKRPLPGRNRNRFINVPMQTDIHDIAPLVWYVSPNLTSPVFILSVIAVMLIGFLVGIRYTRWKKLRANYQAFIRMQKLFLKRLTQIPKNDVERLDVLVRTYLDEVKQIPHAPTKTTREVTDTTLSQEMKDFFYL